MVADVTPRNSMDVAAPAEQEAAQTEQFDTGVLLIVALKAATAALLWVAFLLLWFARGSDPQTYFMHSVQYLFRGNPPGLAIRWMSHNLEFITPVQISRFALATAAYAIVESVEAGGLLLRKRWAEWLVVLVTVSFIPVEVFELIARPMPIKAGTLVINLLILAYLVRRLAQKRAKGLA